MKKSAPVLAALVSLAATCLVSAGEPALPDMKTVARVVHQQLATDDPEWRSTDLITREQAQRAFRGLEKLGWKVADRRAILERLLPTSDELVEKLTTSSQGRKFMRQIAVLPQGYDRVDRLRRIPRGERYLDDLIKGPGGDELIQYFTESRGGEELGRMLGEVPGGADFNDPTGRIYTEQQLLAALATSHRRELKRRAATP